MQDENSRNDTEMQRQPLINGQGIRQTFTTPDITLSKQGAFKTKYPWRTIKVGESFEIFHNEMKKISVAPFVSRMAKKYGKKFKVTNMPEYNCYLVSCILMSEAEAVASSSNLIEALDKMKGK